MSLPLWVWGSSEPSHHMLGMQSWRGTRLLRQECPRRTARRWRDNLYLPHMPGVWTASAAESTGGEGAPSNAPVNAQRCHLSGFQERRSRDVLNVQSLCKSSQDWSHWIEPRRAGDCFTWVSWTSCSSMILHDCGREAFAVGSQTVTTRGVIRLAW